MSQVSYRILWICRVGFPQNSAQQLADFRESFAESSQTIRRNIAGYPRNLRMYLRNDPLKGCRDTFERDCTAIYARFTTSEDDFAHSWKRFCWLDNLRSPKDRLTPTRRIRGCLKDNSADSRKTIPWIPKDNSVGSPQTIRKFPHRLLRKSINFHTDFHRNPRMITTKVCRFP